MNRVKRSVRGLVTATEPHVPRRSLARDPLRGHDVVVEPSPDLVRGRPPLLQDLLAHQAGKLAEAEARVPRRARQDAEADPVEGAVGMVGLRKGHGVRQRAHQPAAQAVAGTGNAAEQRGSRRAVGIGDVLAFEREPGTDDEGLFLG